MRSLPVWFLIVIALLTSSTARATETGEAGEALTIALLTMGPGEHPFTKFGHTAIWVHDALAERDEVYNYGTFSFDSPTALPDSAAGKLPYWLSVQSLEGTLLSYREQGRSLVASELDLTASERGALLGALRENERPEHRYYRYDYFRDNCATRVRDVIDSVIGGHIQSAAQQPASMSYRQHMLRLVGADPLLYAGLDLAVGRNADAKISFWDEGFLPERLHDLLAATRVPRGGTLRPLIRSERTLLRGQVPPVSAAPPQRALGYASLGVALGALLVALGLAARRSARARVALGLSYFVLGVPLGSLSCALVYLSFFSAHSAAAANYNVLLLPPWALVLGVAGIGVMRGKPRALRVALWTSTAAFALSSVALLIHLVTQNAQSNAQELSVALPLWLGAATAAFLLTGPAQARARLPHARRALTARS